MGHMHLRYEGYQLEGQELYAQKRSQRWVEYISIIYFKDTETSEIIDPGGLFFTHWNINI